MGPLAWRGGGYAVDIAVVVAAAVVGAAREIADPNLATKHVAAPVWTYVAAQVLAAVLLLRRRTRPGAVAAGVGALSLFAPATAALFAPYAVTAYGRDRRRGWAAVGVLVVCWMVGAHAWAIADPFSGPALILVSALLGMYVRARRHLLDELAEQARTDERMRLAREMHDVVTHRINLMVLQAGALGVTTTDPATRAAAAELRANGCRALAELRDVVGVLRSGTRTPPARDGAAGGPDHDGTTDAAPDSVVADLVDQSRAVGLPVTLAESGDPATTAPAVRRTLVRVVQESLTNVHKHAPDSTVTVTVRYGPGEARAVIANTAPGRPPDPAVAATGGGSGLLGLRHRVEMVGGTLSAEPTPDGGFAVSATLPAGAAR
ncbi:histidine kinase [Polymorphospora sp. NPDC051019]|uniref:sensor histidine kinase n=1 Tax=Polymorphospora sp. NPDC051019 TaxID=3155725 RepID=UPI0034334B79